MLDASLLLQKKVVNLGSAESLWGASDMYPTYTTNALPLDVAPAGGTPSGVTYGSAPGPITSAAKFSSTNSYISFANTNWQLAGYTDFCVEWWQYTNGSSIVMSLWHPGVAARCAWSTSTASANFSMSGNNATFASYVGSTGLLAYLKWNHVAISRQGTTVRMFANGALMSTTTNSGGFPTGDTNFYLGYRQESVGIAGAPGYLAGVRLTRGAARYTQAFTPSQIFY